MKNCRSVKNMTSGMMTVMKVFVATRRSRSLQAFRTPVRHVATGVMLGALFVKAKVISRLP